ncbi:MAG: hypothetical protein ABWY64_09140 [Tardiphaga sp.]
MAKKPAATSNASDPVIPDQLKKQLEEAEAIRAQMGQGEGAPSPEAEGQLEAEAADVAEPPPGTPPPPEPEESWEQRFRSQAGRLEQMTNTNRQLHERINHLDNLIATMQAKGANAPDPNRPTPAPQYEKLVTDQERNDYGEELLNVVGKRAREEYAPEFDTLKQRIDRLEGRVEGVGRVMEKGQIGDVYAGLDAHVGEEWREINKHPVFKQWLQEPDPYSGRKRHDLLTDAFSRHETGRVVAFFRGFLAEAAGLPQENSSPGQAAPPLPNGNGSEQRPSLEDYAAPGRARSAPQALPADKPIYTSAQIAQFFADKRVGKYRGREADAEAIERDIFQAQHEGRIQ